MRFRDLADASLTIAATSKRKEKTETLAALVRALAPEEIEPAVAFLTGTTRSGRLGVGWASVRDATAGIVPADDPTLTVSDVDRAFARLAATIGSGSMADRQRQLRDLFTAATEPEHRLLWGLLAGEVRHGALDGVVAAAVASATGVTLADLQRAAMLLGSLPRAAEVAQAGGREALARVGLEVLRPVQPMLAGSSTSVAEALAETGPASVEWKLDGARIQVHRTGDTVRVYTRNLNDVTDRLDQVVEVARSLPGDRFVLDGEVLGLDADGRPGVFQDTMSRFGDATTGTGATLRPHFFDVLHLDGADLINEPLRHRLVVLERLTGPWRIEGTTTEAPEVAESVLERALSHGHEGVVVKGLDAPYDAGRRGSAWRKVKPVRTLDLVVLAAEWGHGRRTGWLSNLHLGARGPDGGWLMVGKTFKGLTDQLLTWQTEALQSRALGTDGHVVHVRPELVVEIALDGVQRSSRYPGGVALRFARVRGYRPDRTAADADTIEAVQALLAGS